MFPGNRPVHPQTIKYLIHFGDYFISLLTPKSFNPHNFHLSLLISWKHQKKQRNTSQDFSHLIYSFFSICTLFCHSITRSKLSMLLPKAIPSSTKSYPCKGIAPVNLPSLSGIIFIPLLDYPNRPTELRLLLPSWKQTPIPIATLIINLSLFPLAAKCL